jgi:hypothetical protein
MILDGSTHLRQTPSSSISEPDRSRGESTGIYLSHYIYNKPSEARAKISHVQHFSAFLLVFTASTITNHTVPYHNHQAIIKSHHTWAVNTHPTGNHHTLSEVLKLVRRRNKIWNWYWYWDLGFDAFLGVGKA